MDLYRRTKRATCSRSRKEPNRVILCQDCFSTWVLQKALEDDVPRWQKKRGMEISLSDNDHDCLANLRFADDALLFASSKRTASEIVVRIEEKY